MTHPSLSGQTPGDLHGWREELAHALAQPELAEVAADTEASRRAAYWLAVVLGNCRLCGVELGELDGALPGPMVLAAGRLFLSHLESWTAEAGILCKRLDSADGVVEVNDLCFDVLESRMQAWAAFVAIDEGYHACLEQHSPLRHEIAACIDQILERFKEFDHVILKQSPFLTQIARYPFLENCRRSLAAEYSDPLPWWLDGRLEEEADRIARDPESWLPRKRDFASAFEKLTGNLPFRWQCALYQRFLTGDFPSSCSLPTGLGKTSIIHIWLLALAYAPKEAQVPRRLVYVVNRRTVVDQSTEEARKLRERIDGVPGLRHRLRELCANSDSEDGPPLAISTLRGQFADNREWSADPARPAVIVGTVDMIGSRLLFSGYGVGFKLKPLHAGFLGQDVLLVHDEAHLEKPFQDLLEAIECEQQGEKLDDQRQCLDARSRRSDFRPIRVMALTATPRGGERPFELTEEERNPPDAIPDGPDPLHVAWRRLRAKKTLALVPVSDEKQVVPRIVDVAWKLGEEQPDSRVIIFVRTVDAVTDVEKGLRAKKVPAANISTLTGTMRGLERNRQADPRQENADPVFARFLNPPKRDEEPWKVVPQPGTVYLICTAAGEVGVDISADNLVCDLTPFDGMAQRFGRVNRYGSGDARIDVVYEGKPSEKKKDDPFDQRRWLTLQRLIDLRGDASPRAIAQLPLSDRIAAFTPTPTVLPVSDILFDAWALTTIPGKLPGRPMVEPYLHGISGWEPPETHVGWREEVGAITGGLLYEYEPQDLLEDYPLKPHELLRDNSSRVFDRLKKLKARDGTPVWIVSDDDTVEVMTLAELIDAGKDGIERKTILLPTAAGGLSKDGMLTDNPEPANDVADELLDEKGRRRRMRVWDDDEDYEAKTEDMRLVRRIDVPARSDNEDEASRFWRWFELAADGDTDGSKSNKKPVLWQVHTADVVNHEAAYLAKLPLPEELKNAIVLAAKWHDLGKHRNLFQRMLGNFKYPGTVLAKSGKRGGRIPELYRHELGSLIDVLDEKQTYRAELQQLPPEMQDVVLHLIAVHHGYGRPHFPDDRAFDPEPKGQNVDEITAAVTQRFARLQRRYGRWGLAYLESLLRAADYAASAKPSRFVEDDTYCFLKGSEYVGGGQREAVLVRGG